MDVQMRHGGGLTDGLPLRDILVLGVVLVP
jgi:hypothetical protein